MVPPKLSCARFVKTRAYWLSAVKAAPGKVMTVMPRFPYCAGVATSCGEPGESVDTALMSRSPREFSPLLTSIHLPSGDTLSKRVTPEGTSVFAAGLDG